MPMTSSYSSSLVHSFSDPKCCFLLWKIWIPTLLKWDESQESINRKSCWFVSVTVFFQSTNWIWFCCFNMFRPKCCLIHVMNREHWIVEMTVWWVLQIDTENLLFANQGMKSFSDCKDSTLVLLSHKIWWISPNCSCSFEQSCLITKTGTAEVMRFYQNGPETGLRCKSLISATHFRVLLYDVMIYLHYVFILHNAFHKYISSANLVRCSHHLVAKRWAHQL